MNLLRLRGAALVVVAAAALLAACSRHPAPTSHGFVGAWKSSRMASAPIHLLANGDWEIRSDTGHVMQYGVWRLERGALVWTVRVGGRIEHDRNPVVAFAEGRFQLRERDGSLTTFERLP